MGTKESILMMKTEQRSLSLSKMENKVSIDSCYSIQRTKTIKIKRVNIDEDYHTSKITHLDRTNYDGDMSAISNLLISHNKSLNTDVNTKVVLDPSKISAKPRLRSNRENGSNKDLSINKLHQQPVLESLPFKRYRNLQEEKSEALIDGVIKMQQIV